ncbi:MAG: outer membrane beta-barrel protein [Pseudomonadota bacterium]
MRIIGHYSLPLHSILFCSACILSINAAFAQPETSVIVRDMPYWRLAYASQANSVTMVADAGAAPNPDNNSGKVYLRINLGLASTGNLTASTPDDFSVFSSSQSVTEAEIDRRVGITAGGAVGYDISKSFSAEIEYRFLNNSFDAVEPLNGFEDSNEAASATLDSPGGAIRSNIVLANIIYDFGEAGRFRPFVSAGIGAAKGSFGSETSFVDPDLSSSWGIAFQGRVGFGYELISNLQVGADYSYIGATSTSFTSVELISPPQSLELEGLRNGTINIFVEKRF